MSFHGRYLTARAMALLPDRVKVWLSGTPPVIVDGQQLDPHVREWRTLIDDAANRGADEVRLGGSF